ncbi:hypothetical protein [Pseudomonas yamanorum]|uniref:hypothetical protein n=1 Tax=Pseudomonas yamanorum TaxID=515393 RepID=UPI003F750E2F
MNIYFSKELHLPLLVCVLSALGSWAGVMMAAKYSTSAYQYQKRFEWESKIFDRRIDTIERMARLIARQPGLQDEWDAYQGFIKEAKVAGSPPRESSQRLEGYNAEYQNVLMLAKLYFGMETSQSVDALTDVNSPWWMKSLDKQNAVLEAMIKELRSTLPTFNSTLQAGGN